MAMREALSRVLADQEEESGADRILAAAFFRKRPLQAGIAHVTPASVIPLASKASKRAPTNFLYDRGDRR
jgi:hypothetical protein